MGDDDDEPLLQCRRRRFLWLTSRQLPSDPSGSEPEARNSFNSSTGVQGPSFVSDPQVLVGRQLQQLAPSPSSAFKSRLGNENLRNKAEKQLEKETLSRQQQQQQQQQSQREQAQARSQTVAAAATSFRNNNQSEQRQQGEESRLIAEEIPSRPGELSTRSNCCCCCFKPNMTKGVSFLFALFVAELIGTFILVVIGDGTIATYVLTKQPVNVFVACFAFGIGCMIASFATSKISGAHINPAVSVAFALDGQLKWSFLPIYIAAQYFGGFLAALVIFVNNGEAIAALDGGTRSSFGSGQNSTGHIFATYPAPWTSVWGSLLDQIVGTAVLLFSLSAIGDKNNMALEEKHQPLIVSLVIGLVSMAFNPNCGAIFNPARDLAPRLLTYLVGYPNVWSPTEGLYWLAAGVLGPHIGAILGVSAYRLLIGGALAAKHKHDLETQNLEMKQQQNQLGLLTKLAAPSNQRGAGQASTASKEAALAELGGGGAGGSPAGGYGTATVRLAGS